MPIGASSSDDCADEHGYAGTSRHCRQSEVQRDAARVPEGRTQERVLGSDAAFAGVRIPPQSELFPQIVGEEVRAKASAGITPSEKSNTEED